MNDDWGVILKHVSTAIVGVITGGGTVAVVASFILRYRKQTKDEIARVLNDQSKHLEAFAKSSDVDRTDMRNRINALEKRVDETVRDHVECLKTQAELRAELALQKETVQRMHNENKSINLEEKHMLTEVLSILKRTAQ